MEVLNGRVSPWLWQCSRKTPQAPGSWGALITRFCSVTHLCFFKSNRRRTIAFLPFLRNDAQLCVIGSLYRRGTVETHGKSSGELFEEAGGGAIFLGFKNKPGPQRCDILKTRVTEATKTSASWRGKWENRYNPNCAAGKEPLKKPKKGRCLQPGWIEGPTEVILKMSLWRKIWCLGFSNGPIFSQWYLTGVRGMGEIKPHQQAMVFLLYASTHQREAPSELRQLGALHRLLGITFLHRWPAWITLGLVCQTTSGTGAAAGPSLGTDESAVENLRRAEPALVQLRASSSPSLSGRVQCPA